MTTRVLLVEDHKMVREGLRLLLEHERDIEVVGEASDGRTAIDLVRACPPDVVVMDIGLPGLNGIEATKQIRAAVPAVQVVALSIHNDPRFVAGMFRAGASAYLLKTSAGSELIEAIQRVQAGHNYLSMQITDTLIEDYVHHLAEEGESCPLTARQREVLQLIAEGKTNAQIAARLNVSEKTVGSHRQAIMDILGLHSVAELTQYAIKEGFIFCEM